MRYTRITGRNHINSDSILAMLCGKEVVKEPSVCTVSNRTKPFMLETLYSQDSTLTLQQNYHTL